MEAHLVQFSVVVVGDTHNPTILNPDFLTIRKIVPYEWGWEVEQPLITTPAFSRVQFTNKVSITVEPNKLQITDIGCGDNPLSSKIVEIAQSYVSTLQHVRYKAVGINFHAVVEVEDPENLLKQRFLKSGQWGLQEHPLKAVGLRFAYPLQHGQVVLSLDVGEADRFTEDKKEEKQPVILANANFHRDCKEYPADQIVNEYLQRSSEDWAMYQSLLQKVLEVKIGC